MVANKAVKAKRKGSEPGQDGLRGSGWRLREGTGWIRRTVPAQGSTGWLQAHGNLRPCAPAVPRRSPGDRLLSDHTWGRLAPAAPLPPPAPLRVQEAARPHTHRDSRPMMPASRRPAPLGTMRRPVKGTKEGGTKPSRYRARTGLTRWTELRQ